jgi:Rod binding domain-containing protein
MAGDLSTAAATTAVPMRPIVAPQAGKGATEAQIRKASVDFEAMFLSEMLRPMFEGLKTDSLFGGGHAEEVFRSMMLEQYGKSMARAGGIGLADSVYRTMLKMQEAKTS